MNLPRHIRVLTLLINHKHEILSTKIICDIAFITPAELRRCILKLRQQGVFVCSTTRGQGGYWLAHNLQEAEKQIGLLNKRLQTQYSAIVGMKRQLKKVQQANFNQTFFDAQRGGQKSDYKV